MAKMSFGEVAKSKDIKNCDKMIGKSPEKCKIMMKAIKGGKSCDTVIPKTSVARKVCDKTLGLIPSKPKPTSKKAKKKAKAKAVVVKEEEDREVRTKKTQCTKDWVDKKVKKQDGLSILRTCGTKRIREYAKCHDPAYAKTLKTNPDYKKVFAVPEFKPLFDGSKNGCIRANEERVKMKKGTKSVGFQCANEFKKSCFKELRDGNSDKEYIPFDHNADPPQDKRKFCATQWKERKSDFINPKTKKLKVEHVNQCVIFPPEKVK